MHDCVSIPYQHHLHQLLYQLANGQCQCDLSDMQLRVVTFDPVCVCVCVCVRACMYVRECVVLNKYVSVSVACLVNKDTKNISHFIVYLFLNMCCALFADFTFFIGVLIQHLGDGKVTINAVCLYACSTMIIATDNHKRKFRLA